MGLLGALFSEDGKAKAKFLAEAQAGILSINRARPPFAAEGPFTGWKASGYGPPEHGRWNRDFYTRAQAIYGG
jgi:acyl-CoA reductase-like NAD-dependent aldehyde dehydrogenase